MGQDKKQLTKLLKFVKELYDNPDNKEFAAGIQALAQSEQAEIRDARFEEIYEYCIEKNARKQAEAFYSHFPLTDITNELIEDYLLMTSFMRRGDFLNFSAHLFKQIEGIASYICKNEHFNDAFVNLYNTPALIQYNPDTPMSIFSRKNDSKTIGRFVFGDYESNHDGRKKVDIPLSRQYIVDKIKIALYFGGYATCAFSSADFVKFSYDISNIYQVRCEADHSGGERSAKQETAFKTIILNQDWYYIEFLKTLYYFIEKIAEGYPRWKEVFDFASNLSAIETTAIVSNVLPSALYIKCEGLDPEPVPRSAYSYSVHFENNMEVLVKKKGGTIIQVTPK